MEPVFVDTFYWIALLNPDDPDHDRVTVFDLAPKRAPLVTTEEVLTEFLTYFSGRGTLFRRKPLRSYTLYGMTRTSVFYPRHPEALLPVYSSTPSAQIRNTA